MRTERCGTTFQLRRRGPSDPGFDGRALSARVVGLAPALMFFAVLFFVPALSAVRADEGHSGAEPKKGEGGKKANAVSVRTAERNVQTPQGSFRVRLRQSPSDPRAGEEAQFAVDFSEQVEGGFGGSEPQPVEGAVVTARVTTAAGQLVADKLGAHAEGAGAYGIHYAFGDDGDYKIIFDVRTGDNRGFAADFPVTVVGAPVNWAFWLGLVVLAFLCLATIGGYYYSWGRDGASGRTAARKTAPVAVAAVAFFAIGAVALAYFEPPRQRRAVAAAVSVAAGTDAVGGVPVTGDPALGGSGATITIPKESQLLFSIRTEPVVERKIVSGLTATGTVRARPNARAIISPPVSGRVTLNSNITIGAAIGRGQQIGVVEQILGAPEQAELEGKRIELRTAALEQQARRAEQQALAQQARTRLAQARRELRRATNLLEVGAAPKKRVEEAQTAVQIAEQEVASAEQQARVAVQQEQLASGSVARINPVRTFPLLAPVTGLVTDLKVATGQQVEAGAELMMLVDLTTVFIEAQIFEANLSAARESGRATYTSPALGGEVYRIGEGGAGRLVSVGQSVDPQTRTVGVTYEVPNTLNRLREGMFVEITLDTSGGASVLTVPKRSVINEQGRTFVFVFDGGESFERRAVVLGAEGQDYYEVRSGVEAGERVVTEGIYQLRSTQPGA